MNGMKPPRRLTRAEQLRKDREERDTSIPKRVIPADGNPQLRRVTPGKISQNRRQFRSTATVQPVRIFSRSKLTPPGNAAADKLLNTPVINQISGSIRKKVAIPLKSRGSEIVLPALPILKASSRWISGALAIFLAALLFALLVDPQFKVSEIRFDGLQRLYPGDIEQVLDLDEKPIFAVNPEQVKADLEEYYPELIDPDIQIGLPAVITIRTSERVPVIEWDYNGTKLWIDQEGFIFLPRGEIDRSQLMLIRSDSPPPPAPPPPLSEEEIINLPTPTPLPENFIAEEFQPVVLQTYFYMDPAIIEAAVKLSQLFPAGTGLVYSDENGIGWQDAQGWDVYIGTDLHQLDAKLVVYQAIIKKLTELGIKPSMISVEHINSPFFRN